MQKRYPGYSGNLVIRRPGLPPRRGVRRPGLLGGLVIGGLGYMLGRQQAQQHTQARAAAHNDQLAQLKLLGELRESGILTEEEFQEQKQKILQG